VRLLCFVVLTSAMGLLPTALAATDVQQDITDGHYVAAYEAASAVDTAASQVLAARAASDYAVYGQPSESEQITWLRRGRDAAQRAIELDPDNAAAYVQLARAKGEIARRAGVFESLNVVNDLRDLFEHAIAIDPDNADALVGLAMWNLELTQHGVGWLYGASKGNVLSLLKKGIAAAPEQVNLRVEYATALRALGDEGAAKAQLEKALSLPARSAADRIEQKRAAAMLGL
jgi:tetratricopeptide (TPR) repeat protein